MIGPATPQDLFARLDSLGLAHKTQSHAPVFTVEEARKLRPHQPGGHCKNLFLKDRKDRLYLIVVEAERSLDLNALAKSLGAARFSFGKPDLLMQALGIAPGAVTPLALINDRERKIRVVVDKDFLAHDIVNAHPLTNAQTTAMRPQDLLAFIRACGHEPEILDFQALGRSPI